jgi:hypothetical protein
MNTVALILFTAVGSLAVLLLALLIFLGSPQPTEPRFIKSLRLNMWSEMLAYMGYGLLHPRLFSDRATKAEQKMPFPGDQLVPAANANTTYAITIHAPAERIWPWLLQMGSGRALWYAWSPLHTFPEYKHHLSPVTLHPEWQSLKAGDILTDGDALNQCNEKKGAWRVMEIQDQRAIVFYSARDFIEGIEFDPNTTRPKQIYGITSWVFYIHPVNENGSRLLIRVRAEVGPGLLIVIARLVFGLGDAVFERTILEGIKSRVEKYEKMPIPEGEYHEIGIYS